jgi:hypothetical protein
VFLQKRILISTGDEYSCTVFLQVSTMISAATRTLDSALGSSSSQFSVSQLGSLVYKAGFGVLAGFVLYVVFSTLGLCGNAFAAKTFRGSLCVLVVALLLVWLFGAFFFTGARNWLFAKERHFVVVIVVVLVGIFVRLLIIVCSFADWERCVREPFRRSPLHRQCDRGNF